MNKNREPQMTFRWRKDADGYALAGENIVRRGGSMIEYDPAGVQSGLHRVFANIHTQAWPFAENEGRELSNDPTAPFHMRGFDDVPSAMLAFVNEYGFVGSDRTGADAESENLNYLYKQSSSLRVVMSWSRVLDGYSSKKADAIAGEIVDMPSPHGGKTERRFKPKGLPDLVTYLSGQKLVGPNLRMVFAPSGSRGRMEVHYEPESLYAWMWLRTAEDMTTGVDWTGAPCLYCMGPMGRGPGAHRRDAKFCSDVHRVNFSRLSTAEQRKRQKQAKELTRGHRAGNVGE